jgi:hypothetical protein
MYRTICAALLCLATSSALADETAPRDVALADGALVFTAPSEWKSVEPANRIIEHELAVPAADGKAEGAARLTIMAAGGSVEANIARWVGQFKGTEGGADRSAAKTEKLDINGMPTTLVDLSGIYVDSPRGPFGPKVERPDYRLVGAIVETKGEGVYFFKLIGPEKTVEAGAEKFREVVATLRKK